MAKNDPQALFRRSFEAGTAFLDMTRERAEALVRELVKAGEVSKGKTQKLVDDLLERSRKGSEELRELIRREMAIQVSALGLATKEDVARLEARIDALTAQAAGTPTAAAPVAKVTKAPKAPKAAKVAKAPKAAKKATAGGEAGPASGPTAAGPSTPTGGPPANGPAPG